MKLFLDLAAANAASFSFEFSIEGREVPFQEYRKSKLSKSSSMLHNERFTYI